jgi:acetyl esterase
MRRAIQPQQLRGLILSCGPYDTRAAQAHGLRWLFLRTLLWSYSGSRDFMRDPDSATAAVGLYLSARFPPSFISVGDADSLSSQSSQLAAELLRRSGRCAVLSGRHHPALPHE